MCAMYSEQPALLWREAHVWERPHEGEQCGEGIASQLSHSPCRNLDKQLGLLGKQLDQSVPHFSRYRMGLINQVIVRIKLVTKDKGLRVGTGNRGSLYYCYFNCAQFQDWDIPALRTRLQP